MRAAHMAHVSIAAVSRARADIGTILSGRRCSLRGYEWMAQQGRAAGLEVGNLADQLREMDIPFMPGDAEPTQVLKKLAVLSDGRRGWLEKTGRARYVTPPMSAADATA